MKKSSVGAKCPVGTYCIFRKKERALIVSEKKLKKGEFWILIEDSQGHRIWVASKYLRPLK